jgi:hypothetical protein
MTSMVIAIPTRVDFWTIAFSIEQDHKAIGSGRFSAWWKSLEADLFNLSYSVKSEGVFIKRLEATQNGASVGLAKGHNPLWPTYRIISGERSLRIRSNRSLTCRALSSPYRLAISKASGIDPLGGLFATAPFALNPAELALALFLLAEEYANREIFHRAMTWTNGYEIAP